MLHFSLDDMTDRSSTLSAGDWAGLWDCDGSTVQAGSPPRLVTASRGAVILASSPRPSGPVRQPPYQPERMSGYCAS